MAIVAMAACGTKVDNAQHENGTTATSGTAERFDLSHFLGLLENDEVATANLDDRNHLVWGTLSMGARYQVNVPERFVDELAARLVDAGVQLRHGSD